jgi:hypothetical protein
MAHRQGYTYRAEVPDSNNQDSESETEAGDADYGAIVEDVDAQIEDALAPDRAETPEIIEQAVDLLDYDSEDDESVQLDPQRDEHKSNNSPGHNEDFDFQWTMDDDDRSEAAYEGLRHVEELEPPEEHD